MSSYKDDDDLDVLLDYMAYEGSSKNKKNNKSGGGCLLSLLIMLSPFIGAVVAIGHWIA